jgi:HK97 gp10 family phage protein
MSSGVDVLFNNIAKLPAALRKRAQNVSEAAARQCEALAKINAPVDLGALRAEIHVERVGADAYDVVSSMDYSLPQELGTWKMTAHPYMTPAAEAVRPRFLSDMRSIAEEVAAGGS